jgi:hypothetical protein
MSIGEGQEQRRIIRRMHRMLARPALMTGLFAGLLVSCTASSVLEPPSDIPTASITPFAAPPAAVPSPPAGQPGGAAQGTFEAREPSYGAPQGQMVSQMSGLPSYDQMMAGGGTPQPPVGPGGTAPQISLADATLPPPGTATPSGAEWVEAAPASETWAATQSAIGGQLAGAPAVQSVPEPSPVFVPAAPTAAPAPMQAAPVQAAPAPQPPVQQAAPAPARQAEPRRLAGLLPRALNPLSRREAPSAQSGLPSSERDCQERLRRLGVQFTAKPAVGNGKSCGIAHPVEIAGLSGNIRVRPATTLNCPMAEQLALWVRQELAPGVRKRYLSGISSIGSMGGYSCRTMNSRRGAPMSEHARGNAMDIGSLTLNSGRTIKISSKGFFAFRERGLLNSVRDSGCNYFTTILGPGSDANHADHFHFDLRSRRNGYRHCD